jgi:hypothetical protein
MLRHKISMTHCVEQLLVALIASLNQLSCRNSREKFVTSHHGALAVKMFLIIGTGQSGGF